MLVRHLALFLSFFGGGGVERVMLNLAKGFVDKGLNVDLILRKARGPFLSKVPPDIRIVNVESSHFMTSFAKTVQYMRKERPLALLSAGYFSNVIAIWAKRLARVPTRVMVTAHDNPIYVRGDIKTRLMYLFGGYFYRWADDVVAVSKGVSDGIARITGMSPSCIRVIYNPVIMPDFFDQAKKPLNHPWFTASSPPVILGAGYLYPWKDFATLIKAFAIVRAHRLARLVIIGEGEGRHMLETLVHDLKLDNDVALIGFVDNPYAYMKRSRVFVLSSIREGLPTVLIEAMACGTPVVSTDCPSGPAEILEGGRYGKLVPVGDIEALAKAILTTLDSQMDPTPLIQRACTFSLDNAINQYLEVLNFATR